MLAMDLISIVSMHSSSHADTCTINYIPAVPLSGTSWASWCVHFSPLLSGRERLVAAEGSQPLWDRGLGGKLLLGRRRVSQGWQKHFCFGQAKYSAGIMHLCRYCEAADFPYKALNNFDGIMLLICTLKGRNIHTFSHSKLYHEGIIHRAQDNWSNMTWNSLF